MHQQHITSLSGPFLVSLSTAPLPHTNDPGLALTSAAMTLNGVGYAPSSSGSTHYAHSANAEAVHGPQQRFTMSLPCGTAERTSTLI